MTDKKVWLITGASRGLGLHIAKAALAAGHALAATGRDPKKVAAAIGDRGALLSIKLDVTRPEEVEAAVAKVVEKFGHLDVLVNNAGNFYAGFFEELSPEQVRNQIETLLFGPMNVTRAVLPVMRKQRSGLLMTISSTAGITGNSFIPCMPLPNPAWKVGPRVLLQRSGPLEFGPCWSSPDLSARNY
jgi:NAD(P)-dependent dehydrogenase (short-subunit alcohol dehydrogenase family)